MRGLAEARRAHLVPLKPILADAKLDSASVVSGLLHDTVEDTVLTFADVERLFGKDHSFTASAHPGGRARLCRVQWGVK